MTPTPVQSPVRIPFLRSRRGVFFGAVAGTAVLGTAMMLDIVRAEGLTALELVILGLFVPTFGWISLSFWNATIGFVLNLAGRDPVSLGPSGVRDPGSATVVSRTALVMPAHNEDPERLIAGLGAVIRSLEATGQAGHFDVYLLSDTTDADLARVEEEAWSRLRSRSPRPGRLHYRRRPLNTGRKAGNIADFCETWGYDYDFMVVLDADSVMSGATLVSLVHAMQANPRAGLIQTVPVPARQETLFGRFAQFGAALYSPMLATGQAFWQAESANYWGHNAILRVEPFVRHAQLPVLPGTPPLGGRILSHDFVEAALLRRAGWHVYLASAIGGSYEETPTNILDFAKRDRRWAQGSLQHLRLLREPGLHPLSRLHFVQGAMGYLASVFWLLLLLASTAYVLVPWLSAAPLFSAQRLMTGVFGSGFTSSLVPLLGLTAILLFLPKLLGLLDALVRRRSGFGGGPALVASAVLETAFSILVAPVLMMYHTSFVLGIVAGRGVDWGTQARGGRSISWAEAWRPTAWITATGLLWMGITVVASPMFAAWLAPIFAGLLLAAPLIYVSSSLELGRGLRRRGILLVPSETRTPAELRLPAGNDTDQSYRTEALGRSTAMRSKPRMHEVERCLFDLRRGRPVCVTGAGDPEACVLCAPVEGLDPAILEELKRLGSGPLRLVVTPRRAESMGVSVPPGDELLTGVSLAFNGETPTELFRLASAPEGFDPSRLDAKVATETEVAALDLVRFGRLLPAVVTVRAHPIRVSELQDALESGATLRVGAEHVRTVTATPGTEVVVTHVSEAQVPLKHAEEARFMLFREDNGLIEHVAILIGDERAWPDPLPVRIHSACITGDLFGSLRCDCGEQLRGSLTSFAAAGGGVLLYMQQEGRGIGLGNKLRAYALQHEGLDTIDADQVLGFGSDERRYDAAVGMLQHLGVERVRILTNNPEKVRALQEGGIEVTAREPLHGTLNPHNLPYVRAKVERAGHWLGDMLQNDLSGK